MEHKNPIRISVLIVILGTSLFALWPQTADTLLTQIERLASLGSKGDRELSDSIAWQIDANRKEVAALLLPKLGDSSATESQIATYAWALGWAKDSQATDSLITLYNKNASEWIKHNCSRALAMIGGQAAGDFLISVLDEKTDEDERYSILDLLAEMQYEAALSRSEDILELDFKEYYWKPIFLFGKMGDKAVPFLLSKIDNEDLNVRTHSVHLLGQWLMALEAAEPLRKRFWEEKDQALQIAILGAIASTDPDFESWKMFFERVHRESQKSAAVKFAGETLASIDRIRTSVNEFIRKKSISKTDFDREYAKLYKSAGLAGDYDIIKSTSSIEDEPKLKKLREHILIRNSDESFYDYRKINNIIAFNRLGARMKVKK